MQHLGRIQHCAMMLNLLQANLLSAQRLIHLSVSGLLDPNQSKTDTNVEAAPTVLHRLCSHVALHVSLRFTVVVAGPLSVKDRY